MADKVAELEEKVNRLEERLKLIFAEIEKRFAQQQPQIEVNVEERLQELEDLLLLLHLESTKMREKVGEGLDFGITPTTPDISERLTRIESELASRTGEGLPGLDAKIATLEEQLNAVRVQPANLPEDMENRIKESLAGDVEQLEKKVKTLEALLAERGRKELDVEESTLLNDVRNILRG